MELLKPAANIEKLVRMGYIFNEKKDTLEIKNVKDRNTYKISIKLCNGNLTINFDPNMIPDLIIKTVLDMATPSPESQFYVTNIDCTKEKKEILFQDAGWNKISEKHWQKLIHGDLVQYSVNVEKWFDQTLSNFHKKEPLFIKESQLRFVYRGEIVIIELEFQDRKFTFKGKIIENEKDVHAIIDTLVSTMEKQKRLKQLYEPNLYFTERILRAEYYSEKTIKKLSDMLLTLFLHEELEKLSAEAIKKGSMFELKESQKGYFITEMDVLNIEITEYDNDQFHIVRRLGEE